MNRTQVAAIGRRLDVTRDDEERARYPEPPRRS